MQQIQLRYPLVYCTPITCRTSNGPPPDCSSDDCPVLLQYPDQFIPNTRVTQNSSTSPDTPPLTLVECPRHLRHHPPLRTPCPVITRSRYSSSDELPLRASCIIQC